MNGLGGSEVEKNQAIINTHLIFVLTLPNSSLSGTERSDEHRVRVVKKLEGRCPRTLDHCMLFRARWMVQRYVDNSLVSSD